MIARRVIIFWQKLRQQLDEKTRQNPTLQEPRRKTRQSTANQKLRPIIIDGQNVAIEHGKEVYSGKEGSRLEHLLISSMNGNLST